MYKMNIKKSALRCNEKNSTSKIHGTLKPGWIHLKFLKYQHNFSISSLQFFNRIISYIKHWVVHNEFKAFLLDVTIY